VVLWSAGGGYALIFTKTTRLGNLTQNRVTRLKNGFSEAFINLLPLQVDNFASGSKVKAFHAIMLKP
jgi:hypothetical protein